MNETSRVDAIVAGSGLNALGVVRSLGRAGLTVGCIAASPDSPPMRSRFARHRRVAPAEGPALLDAIAALAGPGPDRVPLFLTEEDTVQYLATRQSDIPPFATCRLPGADVLLRLLDKSTFDAFCHENGFPVPRTLCVLPGDQPTALGELRYPVIVKAATKPADYGLRFKKAYIAEAPRTAAEYAAMLADATGQAVVQEWIPGGDDRILFCLQYVGASGPVASFVGQKLASWPPMYGGTAICTAAPERYRSKLSDLTTEFFARAGFQGMGSMEFKLDDRDGTAYMIEPTVGRTDFQEEVATVNGVNLPLAAWRYEVGRPVPEARYRAAPRLWMDSVDDRTAQPAERLRAFARRLTAVDATWRWYDPMPFVGREADRIRSGLRRRIRRLSTDR